MLETNDRTSLLEAIQAARKLHRKAASEAVGSARNDVARHVIEMKTGFSKFDIPNAEALEHSGFSIIGDLESCENRSLSMDSALMGEGLEFQNVLKKVVRQQKRMEGLQANPIVAYLEKNIKKIDDLLAIKAVV